jgi:hypothetical protein
MQICHLYRIKELNGVSVSHIVGHLWDKCGMDLHRYQFSAVADLVMEKRDFEHKKSQSDDWLKGLW